MTILIGADPELFIKHKTTGEYRGAHEFIPGSKNYPAPVKRGAVQVDGFAAEFNIDPARTVREFVRNTKTVLKQLKEMVPEDFDLDVSPVAMFEEDYFDSTPEMVKELGCDPDFDAYSVQINPPPKEPRKGMRTGAGHIHLGFTEMEDIYDNIYLKKCASLIKIMDVMVGVPSVLYDDSEERRSMYGKAGTFRPKPYGAEYRTLSNVWVSNEELMEKVFKQSKAAVEMFLSGNSFSSEITMEARMIIDNSLKKDAESFIDALKLEA